ncbi:MAG: zinc-ribbon domain-containing protein [Verrucomicrobiota bacterium]|jgi:predicted amidophosphoribosyltransferase
MAAETCPNCGAEVPANARACPECGSDEQTGWSEEAQRGGLDLPEEDFNYEDYVAREFGSRRPAPRGVHWFWWVVGLLAVAAFLAFSFWWR